MPYDLDTESALRLGAALAPLRDQGTLIIGSGGLTHNLHEFRQRVHDPDYTTRFAMWIYDAIMGRNTQALAKYRHLAPNAQRAHPTEEHFLPLLVAIGATKEDDKVQWLPGRITDSVLSMDSYVWGATQYKGDAQ